MVCCYSVFFSLAWLIVVVGKEGEFKSKPCPVCRSTIILTGLPETPQLYCPYCNNVFTVDASAIDMERETAFTLCPVSQLWTKTEEFSEIYVFFCVFAAAFTYRKIHCCPSAMRYAICLEAWFLTAVVAAGRKRRS